MTGEILAAQKWRSNAELIVDVAAIGYLLPSDRVLDPTFEGGVWWKLWRPDPEQGGELVTNDVEADADGWDYRECPHPDGSFDVVAYDPPYVAVGGRETSTVKPFLNRFGLDRAPKNPTLLLEMNVGGLAEMRRVTRPGGLILLKYQNQVWSGNLFLGVNRMLDAAEALGLRIVDQFVFVGDNRAQPGNRTRKCSRCKGTAGDETCAECAGVGRVDTTQQHARQNVSYLTVLRRPKSDQIGGTLFDCDGHP